MMTSRTPPAPTSRGEVTMGQYLAARLHQAGVRHLFGLPGDFNLALLDEVLAHPGLAWVGSTNELNAAYAADGYARTNGLGALVTTYGVGELSALNGVAGAYAEHVPLVQVTGSPSTATAAGGALSHHTLLDGDFGHFVRAYAEVTAVAEVLLASTGADQVDHALTVAVDDLRPVYLSIPTDVATAPVQDAAVRLSRPLARRVSDPAALVGLERALFSALSQASTAPVVLVGDLLVRRSLRPELHALADSGRARVATLLSAKGALDEGHPAALGCYVGGHTPGPGVRGAVEDAEVLVLAGAVLSDVVTGMFSHRLRPLVELDLHAARVGDQHFADVELADAVRALTRAVGADPSGPAAAGGATAAPADATAVPADATAVPADATAVPADDVALTQAELWRQVQEWLPPDTPVLADAGTAYYGVAELRFPPGTELIGQPAWSSIGYTLPAALGVALAGAGRAGAARGSEPARPVLLIGDGAAQLSAQELSTLVRAARPPVVVLIDNAGYTIERAIRSPRAVYQDVAPWNWCALVAALAPDVAVTTVEASTPAQLRSALARVSGSTGPVLVHLHLHPDDVPPLLARVVSGLRGAEGTPGSDGAAVVRPRRALAAVHAR